MKSNISWKSLIFSYIFSGKKHELFIQSITILQELISPEISIKL